MTVMAACSNDDTPAPETEQPTNPIGSGETRTLVAYFSAQGHTQAVAERITELLGADIFRIEAADPYAENPYDEQRPHPKRGIQRPAARSRQPARCGNHRRLRHAVRRFALLVAPARDGGLHLPRSV